MAGFTLRLAVEGDAPALRELMGRAIAELQKPFLTREQIEASREVMGLDSQLIEDRTYFVAVEEGRPIGCGGWSWRSTLYGGDHSGNRDASAVDPETCPARVRAMYTDPDHVRKGVGAAVLKACESAARERGFRRIEMMATLAGVPLYERSGYSVMEETGHETSMGISVPLRLMGKDL